MKPGWRYSLTVRKGRYFFAQRLAGQDQDVIYMRTGLNGRDRALVDPHAWSRDHSASAELLDVSPDGTLIAYGVREGGEDETTVKLLDVDTRKEMPDRLPRARYRSVSLKAHRTGLFYARIGEEGPRLYYHAIGADPVGDQEIFGQGLGREKVLSAGISDDGRYLVILLEHGRGGSARTEIFCQDLQKEGPIFPVIKDIDAKFYGAVGGDVLFLRTNWHAPRGRILAVDLNNPAPEHWREVVPQEQAAIQDFYLAGGKLIVGYLENAASRVSVFEPDGRHVRDFNLPAMGSAYDISGQWSNLRVPSSSLSGCLGFRNPHGQPGVLDTQVEPLVNQTFEPLVGHDLAAKLLHPFSADVLRAALHPAGIADLPVGPGVVLGVLVLAGQRARAHGADLQ